MGNDFLPHLPYLSIREGSIDALVFLYQQLLSSSGEYLTCEGSINFSMLE